MSQETVLPCLHQWKLDATGGRGLRKRCALCAKDYTAWLEDWRQSGLSWEEWLLREQVYGREGTS